MAWPAHGRSGWRQGPGSAPVGPDRAGQRAVHGSQRVGRWAGFGTDATGPAPGCLRARRPQRVTDLPAHVPSCGRLPMRPPGHQRTIRTLPRGNDRGGRAGPADPCAITRGGAGRQRGDTEYGDVRARGSPGRTPPTGRHLRPFLVVQRALSPFLVAAPSGLGEEALPSEASEAAAGDVHGRVICVHAEEFVQLTDPEHLVGVLIEGVHDGLVGGVRLGRIGLGPGRCELRPRSMRAFRHGHAQRMACTAINATIE